MRRTRRRRALVPLLVVAVIAVIAAPLFTSHGLRLQNVQKVHLRVTWTNATAAGMDISYNVAGTYLDAFHDDRTGSPDPVSWDQTFPVKPGDVASVHAKATYESRNTRNRPTRTQCFVFAVQADGAEIEVHRNPDPNPTTKASQPVDCHWTAPLT